MKLYLVHWESCLLLTQRSLTKTWALFSLWIKIRPEISDLKRPLAIRFLIPRLNGVLVWSGKHDTWSYTLWEKKVSCPVFCFSFSLFFSSTFLDIFGFRLSTFTLKNLIDLKLQSRTWHDTYGLQSNKTNTVIQRQFK